MPARALDLTTLFEVILDWMNQPVCIGWPGFVCTCDPLVTMDIHINPWGAMMLMARMDDCKISHMEVYCSG